MTSKQQDAVTTVIHHLIDLADEIDAIGDEEQKLAEPKLSKSRIKWLNLAKVSVEVSIESLQASQII